MTSYADVAIKALDMIMRPSGLAVLVVIAVIVFAFYSFPLWLVTDSDRLNTDRIVAAIKEHCGSHTPSETIRISEK